MTSKSITVTEALKRLEKGGNMEGVTIDFENIKVKALDAFKLGKVGIEVPDEVIEYDDADIAYDPDFDDYEWERTDIDPIEDLKENWYVRPVFFVSNCAEAIKFYQSIGFYEKWKFEEAGKIVAAQLNLNGIELILNENESKAGKGRLFISLAKGEVKEYLSSIKNNKVDVEDIFWGMPTKAIRDIDGNDILLYDDELTTNK